jgi:hypothetical protein
MLGSLSRFLRKKDLQPATQVFADEVLGEFTFDRDLGWKKPINLGGQEAELVLGSDGEPPSEAMLQTARSWLESWNSKLPSIVDYIRSQLRGWSDEPDLPEPEKFELESVNILWKDKPDACMIYFHYPGDDLRLWHVTFYGVEPHGFAYDD